MPGRGGRPLGLAAFMLLVAPRIGAAQLSASFDAGWASVEFDGYLRSSVVTLSPSIRLDSPLSVIAGRGTLSLFASGSKSVDLALAASTFTKALGPWRAEFTGSGGGTLFNGFGTGYVSASTRIHAIWRNKGLWFGGSGGYVDDGIANSALTRYGAGVWARFGGLSVNAGATHLSAVKVGVSDLETGARYSRGAMSLSASGGVRLGASDLLEPKRWGELTGVFWLNRHLALTAAHGRYPSEPGRGTPGANYTSISLRIASRPMLLDVAAERNPRYQTPAIARPVVAAFQVKRIGDSTQLISIRAPGARRVEITGDFTDWEPVEMERKASGDNFTLKLKVPIGSHKFNVKVDAGEWGVPPGVPMLRDELAGVVALLIIPPS